MTGVSATSHPAGGARETIVRAVRKAILELEAEDVQRVECNTVADRARTRLESGNESICARYGFMQYLLDVTRRELARSYGAESHETQAIQGDLYTGTLQARYPVPHQRGESPQYVLLDLLTPEQVRWNARQHRKVGRAHLRHADALDAYAHTKASSGDAA
ncbi:hypothetical protein BTH42_31880 [Burkholderia sp. SRS-W-2-2016]|uniref:hypothetical protein n=1 Tax=Burkholderia sp. SRS-W-2-2016 TaxID=1926878 RepID=UPI00094B0150|nr:hypothetical protein [Burkholderia sp. SRS-W-2-2016]OLL27448.1 hypothetical protein BTH42_31880 [Burkholderia sp. SRS-W-2-2016]